MKRILEARMVASQVMAIANKQSPAADLHSRWHGLPVYNKGLLASKPKKLKIEKREHQGTTNQSISQKAFFRLFASLSANLVQKLMETHRMAVIIGAVLVTTFG
jgi:hypothetical protein